MRTPHDALIATLAGTDGRFRYVSPERAEAQGLVAASRLPLTLKILVEGALRHAEDPACLDLAALADRPRRGTLEFQPARLLLQDFTGIPLMTDMASLRDEIARRGGDPAKANPRIPIDFVCDHALIAVHGGRPDAQALNEEIEIARNRERYEFLKWCAGAFANIRLIPPGSGIMHQLNLEWLSTVVFLEQTAGMTLAPRTRCSAPTATRRWSAAWACWAGVSAVSTRRPRCSATVHFSTRRASSGCD
jgi:aconitate hydratase